MGQRDRLKLNLPEASRKDDFIIQTETLLRDEEHSNNNDTRTTGINQIYPREIKTHLFHIKGEKLGNENNLYNIYYVFLVQKSQVSSNLLCPYMIFNKSI